MSDPWAASGEVRLKPGRDASVRRGHPWLYRGALAGPLPGRGGPVTVLAASGQCVGVALPGASGGSLALRMLTFGDEPWRPDTLHRRLAAALALRRRLGIDADAYRLVHAEGDGLPALVVDLYAGVAVVQVFEPAWQPFLAELAEALGALGGTRSVMLRRGDTRGGAAESLAGTLPPGPIVVREGRALFQVDLLTGQKTGFFLDQRDNRRRVGELAGGADVLNLFSYSGGFAVTALLGGARRAVNVDASAAALELARASCRLNGLPVGEGDLVAGDAFQVTRELVASGTAFDVVVVDPPAFVKRRPDLARGLAGYRDINLQALRLVRQGGLLLTCSCSALVDEEEFARAVQGAAVDAGRFVRVLERRGAGPDHPVALACPEARHLKVLLCAVG